MSTANTNQKEHTMTDFEHLVKCPTPDLAPFELKQFHVVPHSKSTIHARADGRFTVGERRPVYAYMDTPPEALEQQASDALLLAEHLRELQAAVQAEKDAEKDAQQLEKEAQALYESIGYVNWHHIVGSDKSEYLTMARKAREIHGVSK